jgi:hypothetical protein
MLHNDDCLDIKDVQQTKDSWKNNWVKEKHFVQICHYSFLFGDFNAGHCIIVSHFIAKLYLPLFYMEELSSSVSSVWLRAGQPSDLGSIPSRGREDFSSSLYVHTGSGAHPASSAMGTGVSFAQG